MNLDLNEMAVFAVVAEQGSFTRAAKKLGLTKSSVSRHVSQLEERLEARLIHRTTRSMTLTEVGKMYLEHCQRIVEEADSARSSLASLQSQPAGHLRITAPLAFGAPLLQSVFNKFLHSHPKINMDLILDNRVVDLVDEEIDLAVRVGPLQESSLVARSLGTAVQCFCATPDYLNAHGVPNDLDDLLKHNVIKHPNVMPVALESGKLVSTNSRFTVNDMGVIASVALQSLGVGLLPLPLVYQEIKAGKLLPVLLDHPLEAREFFLVYPSRRQLASKTLAFVNYMQEEIQTMNYWNVSVKEFLEAEGIEVNGAVLS